MSNRKLGPMLLGQKHIVYEIPWGFLQQVLSERGATRGVYFSWCRRDPRGGNGLSAFPTQQQRFSRGMLTSQKSPPAPQSNMALWEGVFMPWKISQSKATEKSEGQSGVNPLPGAAGRQWKDWAQVKNITGFLLFGSRRRWVALILNLDIIQNVFLI